MPLSPEPRFLSVRVNDGVQSRDPLAQDNVPYFSDILRIDYYDSSTRLIKNVTTSQSFANPWVFRHAQPIVYASNILGAIQGDEAFGRMWLCKAPREVVDGVKGDVFILVWRVRRIIDVNRSLTTPYDASPPHLQSAISFLSAANPISGSPPAPSAHSAHSPSPSKPPPSKFPYPDSFRSHPIFASRLENVAEKSGRDPAYSTTIEQGMKEVLQRENVRSFQVVLSKLESETRLRLAEGKRRKEAEERRAKVQGSRSGMKVEAARWGGG